VDVRNEAAVRVTLGGARLANETRVDLDRVMVRGDDVVRQYGSLRSIPTTLIIDKWGRIAVTHAGFFTKGEYETDTKALLSEN